MKLYNSIDEMPNDCQELVKVGDLFYNISKATEEELDLYDLRPKNHPIPTNPLLERIGAAEVAIKKKYSGNFEDEEKNQAFQYLQETDWFIIREMDTGIPTPEEIKNLRQEARSKL
jgi:hypothetical protein